MLGLHFTLWGGIGTIGGTKLLIDDGQQRLLFDFGSAVRADEHAFDARLRPRRRREAEDLLAGGMLPPIDGLYTKTTAASANLTPSSGALPVFITHNHLDHMALLGQLAPETPVYYSPDAYQMLLALEQSEQGVGAHLNAVHQVPAEGVQVGDFRVDALPVDHDTDGASAYLIRHPQGTLLYSGDLRLHGAHPERTRAMMAAAHDAKVDVLFLEGTRLTETADAAPVPDETKLPSLFAEALAHCRGLALITLYPRHTERIATLAQTASQNGRLLVLEPETYALLAAMGRPLDHVAVYRGFEDQDAALAQRLAPWKARLGPTVDAAAIRQSPQSYVLQLFYGHLTELSDLKPPEGSIYIHSNGEPLGPFDPGYTIARNWLARYGLSWVALDSSGHASPTALVEIARGIAPRLLVPIHSMKPENLEVPGMHRLLPERGVRYSVQDLLAKG